MCCGDVGGRGAWLGVVVSYLTQGAATMVKVAAAQRGSLPRGVLTAAAHRPEWHAVFGPPHDGTSAARKQLGGERETARAAHTQLRMHLLIRNAARSVRVELIKQSIDFGERRVNARCDQSTVELATIDGAAAVPVPRVEQVDDALHRLEQRRAQRVAHILSVGDFAVASGVKLREERVAHLVGRRSDVELQGTHRRAKLVAVDAVILIDVPFHEPVCER